MSRTDAHTPIWVLKTGPDWRRDFIDWHDHRDGVCDLDEHLAAREWVGTRCTRDINGLRRVCSCWLCGGQAARKLGYRQERTWWRKQRHTLLTTAQEDRDTLDVPPFHSSAW